MQKITRIKERLDILLEELESLTKRYEIAESPDEEALSNEIDVLEARIAELKWVMRGPRT